MTKDVHIVNKCMFSQRYKIAGQDTIVLAGAEYGSGSSRDWAAKGPMLQVSGVYIYALSSDTLLLNQLSVTFFKTGCESCDC